MAQNKEYNRSIVLAARPKGAPVPENFRLVQTPVPQPGQGQVLLRTEYLSLDPYMRGRMSDAPSYAEPVKIDQVMVGGNNFSNPSVPSPGLQGRGVGACV